MHSHPCTVVYTTQNATVRFSSLDGLKGQAGAVYWNDGAGRVVLKRKQAFENLAAGRSQKTLEIVDRAD